MNFHDWHSYTSCSWERQDWLWLGTLPEGPLEPSERSGYNQRFAIIAGTGELGRKVLEKIELYPELGIQVTGFLTRSGENVGETIRGIPVIGVYEDLDKILAEERVDVFWVAVPIQEYDCLESILKKVRGGIPDVKVVPGALEFLSLRGGVDELDGLAHCQPAELTPVRLEPGFQEDL